MAVKKENTKQFHRIELAAMPSFNLVTKDREFVSYGYNNALLYELIELYNTSSKHNALITSKVNYITGNGLKSKTKDPASLKVISSPNLMESGVELLEKLSSDNELFGGYYLQFVFGKVGGKLAAAYHVPFQDIMPNEDGTKFLYKKEGKKYGFKNAETFAAFDPNNRKGTCIFYVREYRIGSGILTLPSYYASLKYVKIDAEIANFNYNNIASGFSAGTMIVLKGGKPETEEQENEVIRNLKANTSGTEKAGETIVYFAGTEENPPEIIALNGNDLVDRFNQLEQICQENIFIGHKVVNPSLFGIKTAGQLGSTQELIISWDLFKQGYIEPRQKQLESTYNLMARLMGGIGDIAIDGMTPINVDYIDLFDRGLVSKITAQKELGLPIDVQMSAQRKAEDIEVYSKFGSDENDFEVVKSFNNFIEFDAAQESKALAIIAANPQIDTPSLINALEISAKDGADVIKELEKKGYISTNSGLQVTPDGKLQIETPTRFFVKYRYTGIVDPATNRPFCAKLLSLKKLFSRQEIDQISNILGYNVWMRKGGWYHNPDLDVNTPYCRHRWEQVIVKSKSNFAFDPNQTRDESGRWVNVDGIDVRDTKAITAKLQERIDHISKNTGIDFTKSETSDSWYGQNENYDKIRISDHPSKFVERMNNIGYKDAIDLNIRALSKEAIVHLLKKTDPFANYKKGDIIIHSYKRIGATRYISSDYLKDSISVEIISENNRVAKMSIVPFLNSQNKL